LIGWRTDWAEVGGALGRIRIDLWLAAVLVLLVTQVFSAWRWQVLARPFGFERCVGQLLGYYLIGMYFNLLLPTSVGGDVVRAWYLDGGSRQRGAALVAVFVDRFSGLVVLLGFGCVGLALAPPQLPAWIPLFVLCTTLAAVCAVAAACLLARHGQRFPAIGKIRTAAGILRSPRLFALSTVLSLGVQGGNIVLVWLVGLALGADIPFGYYWVLVPMVTLLTMLPISVNGMGVRESAMVLFLQPLGIAAATAVPLALGWFAVFLAVSLAGGLVYLLGRFQRPPTAMPQPLAADPSLSDPLEAHDGPFHNRADQGRARQPRAVA
jgi:uncharacterized membrane protein YbhN (UPF0104 family)